MFAVYCPTHQAEVVLGPSLVRRVTNVDGLIAIELECSEGERVFYYTGRRFHEFLRARNSQAGPPGGALA